MNEEELKNLWQADNAAPTIDFAALQKSLSAWQNKLRRKVKIDIWAQSVTAALTLIPVFFFYPRLIVFSLLIIILGIWYVRELRQLSNLENNETDYVAVKHSLNLKIQTMKNYFRRTRIAMYGFTPITVPAVFYGIGAFDKSSMTFTNLLILIAGCVVIYEILLAIATEIYFKILYVSSFNELKNLLWQLDSDE